MRGSAGSILKKFDAFIEAIVERKTLAENVVPDVSGIGVSAEASAILDKLMAYVPPPLMETARAKVLHGALRMTSASGEGNGDAHPAVGTEAIVLAFWMGTPEPSRPPVRQALEQMGLWRIIAAGTETGPDA